MKISRAMRSVIWVVGILVIGSTVIWWGGSALLNSIIRTFPEDLSWVPIVTAIINAGGLVFGTLLNIVVVAFAFLTGGIGALFNKHRTW